MKCWVPSGVFLAAGDYLSLAFLRGQVLSYCRQTRLGVPVLRDVATGAALLEGSRDHL